MRGRELALVLSLALLYTAAGRLGLQLDAVSGFATLVWAPSGIALAALLFFGLRLWPGVTLGALAVNLWAGAPLLAASGIALGNTLEPVIAVLLLRQLEFKALNRARDVVLLILLAAAFSTMIAATIGTLSLTLTGVVPVARFGLTWSSWWLGDAIGDLIVAPLLLVWFSPSDEQFSARRRLEALALSAVLIAISLVIFGRRTSVDAVVFLQPYLLVPPLIWAAVRFRERGAATAVFIGSVIAVGGTAAGLGPFGDGAMFERLGALQAFMAMVASTFLVLAALAAERTHAERALQEAKEAAEAASGAKSRFLAVISHELRTPLTAVTGYADLLLEGVVGQLNQKQTSYIERVRAAAWHLTSVIEGILTFSRADAGREEARLQKADVVAIVRETAALLAPQASAQGLHIDLAAPAEPLVVYTDAGKLRQILLNLIGNAVKFSKAGTILVAVTTGAGRFQVRVTDQGPGIPTDRLEDIFQPFTQLDNARAVGGTGLGLSATRMLAQLLGGTVTVTSEAGQGSTFTVDLPLESRG